MKKKKLNLKKSCDTVPLKKYLSLFYHFVPHLVLFGGVTLGTDEYPDDPGMAVSGRGVQGRITILNRRKKRRRYTWH
jgi:hypothetical protein